MDRDVIFQKNSWVHPFWPQKKLSNCGRIESRSSWWETKKIFKLATSCNKYEQQQDATINAEL
jgi:hypothetical protein